jgi:hypothetical protein
MFKAFVLLSIIATGAFSIGHLPDLDEGDFGVYERNPEKYFGCVKSLLKNKPRKLPPITLVIEKDHSDPKEMKIREDWLKKAEKGEVVLAGEGATLKDSLKEFSNGHVIGLEQEESHVLAGLLKVSSFYRPTITAGMSYDDWDHFNKRTLLSFLLPMLRTYGTLREAWLEFNPTSKPIYVAITEWAKNLQKKDSEVIEKLEIGYEISLPWVLRDLAVKYADFIYKKNQSKKELAFPDQFLELVQDSAKLISSADPAILIVNWRNYTFIRSLKIAVKKALEVKKPLVVIVGAQHAKFIEDWFRLQ